MTTQKKKVLVVDDSAVMRRIIRDLISRQPDLEFIGEAGNAAEAREAVKRFNPDVMTLDVEMPHMDGLTFLEKVMQLRPMPVVMASTLTHQGAEHCIRALEIGAAACVGKPSSNPDDGGFGKFSEDLLKALREAAAVDAAAMRNISQSAQNAKAAPASFKSAVSTFRTDDKNCEIVAIGASTGGVEALSAILPKLPNDLPPIVVTQHMPAGFTSMFAKRLNTLCLAEVKEAVHRESLKNGHIYIAPGTNQFTVKRKSSGELACAMGGEEKISGHCPSVDYLFNGVAETVGNKALAVILTGMGSDGAEGMKRLRGAGAYTIGQNASTSVVYGMPKAAMENGSVCRQAALGDIAGMIVNNCRAKAE